MYELNRSVLNQLNSIGKILKCKHLFFGDPGTPIYGIGPDSSYIQELYGINIDVSPEERMNMTDTFFTVLNIKNMFKDNDLQVFNASKDIMSANKYKTIIQLIHQNILEQNKIMKLEKINTNHEDFISMMGKASADGATELHFGDNSVFISKTVLPNNKSDRVDVSLYRQTHMSPKLVEFDIYKPHDIYIRQFLMII